MPTKHDPDYGNDRYSEEETAKRRDATIKAMLGMKPKPHPTPTPKGTARPASKGRVHKDKTQR
jgi:hypothetical protein